MAMETLPELPHPLHEWVEIQVGQEGDLVWSGGLYSPDGARRLVYEHAHIILWPNLDEAIKIGEAIAQSRPLSHVSYSGCQGPAHLRWCE